MKTTAGEIVQGTTSNLSESQAGATDIISHIRQGAAANRGEVGSEEREGSVRGKQKLPTQNCGMVLKRFA
jgi:hypothetical protein